MVQFMDLRHVQLMRAGLWIQLSPLLHRWLVCLLLACRRWPLRLSLVPSPLSREAECERDRRQEHDCGRNADADADGGTGA